MGRAHAGPDDRGARRLTAMGHALFYHLTRSGPEDLVRMLVGRAFQAGWRVAMCPR